MHGGCKFEECRVAAASWSRGFVPLSGEVFCSHLRCGQRLANRSRGSATRVWSWIDRAWWWQTEVRVQPHAFCGGCCDGHPTRTRAAQLARDTVSARPRDTARTSRRGDRETTGGPLSLPDLLWPPHPLQLFSPAPVARFWVVCMLARTLTHMHCLLARFWVVCMLTRTLSRTHTVCGPALSYAHTHTVC